MQICYCGWSEKWRATAPLIYFGWTMVYIAPADILESYSAKMYTYFCFYWIYRYINILTHTYEKEVLYGENSICLHNDGKRNLDENKCFIWYYVAVVLVRWCRWTGIYLVVKRLPVKLSDREVIARAATPVASSVLRGRQLYERVKRITASCYWCCFPVPARELRENIGLALSSFIEPFGHFYKTMWLCIDKGLHCPTWQSSVKGKWLEQT